MKVCVCVCVCVHMHVHEGGVGSRGWLEKWEEHPKTLGCYGFRTFLLMSCMPNLYLKVVPFHIALYKTLQFPEGFKIYFSILKWSSHPDWEPGLAHPGKQTGCQTLLPVLVKQKLCPRYPTTPPPHGLYMLTRTKWSLTPIILHPVLTKFYVRDIVKLTLPRNSFLPSLSLG